MVWDEGGYESSPTDFITYLIIFFNYIKITIEKLLKALKNILNSNGAPHKE